LDNNYFLEECDYLNDKLPDYQIKLVLRPKLVLRSSCYAEGKVTQCIALVACYASDIEDLAKKLVVLM